MIKNRKIMLLMLLGLSLTAQAGIENKVSVEPDKDSDLYYGSAYTCIDNKKTEQELLDGLNQSEKQEYFKACQQFKH